MADQTLDQLAIADPLDGDEQIYLVQAGLDRRVSTRELVTSKIRLAAGETLGGHKAAKFNNGVFLASAADAGDVLGITTGAANAGEPVTVQTNGRMDEPSWSWAPFAPIFLGANGALTADPSGGAYLHRLGIALSPTAILIRIEPPVQL